MDMGSPRRFFCYLICAICASLVFLPVISAQNVSSRPADLADNEKVIYELPDIGSITPDNPLFVFKQLRDGVLLALSQNTVSRVRTLIQLSDKYTVYAEKFARLSKTERSVQTFQTAMSYQSTMIEILEDKQESPNSQDEVELRELQHIARQSNIKQAETIRLLMDDISTSEQPAFVLLLDKNIQLRKRLQTI
ncbi:hypothetical protein KBB12_02130 [Candidatus Woesebacteria bacterium]|nr:hypothetical protein [Candidatus Woesebacteria bacterium]